MLREIEDGVTYLSKVGLPFRVLHKAKHGQDCTVPMVVYVNLTPTFDAPTGTVWTVSESFFLGRFSELGDINLNELINSLKGD